MYQGLGEEGEEVLTKHVKFVPMTKYGEINKSVLKALIRTQAEYYKTVTQSIVRTTVSYDGNDPEETESNIKVLSNATGKEGKLFLSIDTTFPVRILLIHKTTNKREVNEWLKHQNNNERIDDNTENVRMKQEEKFDMTYYISPSINEPYLNILKKNIKYTTPSPSTKQVHRNVPKDRNQRVKPKRKKGQEE